MDPLQHMFPSFPLLDAETLYQFGSPRGDDACFVFLDTRVVWLSYEIDKIIFRRLMCDRGSRRDPGGCFLSLNGLLWLTLRPGQSHDS